MRLTKSTDVHGIAGPCGASWLYPQRPAHSTTQQPARTCVLLYSVNSSFSCGMTTQVPGSR